MSLYFRGHAGSNEIEVKNWKNTKGRGSGFVTFSKNYDDLNFTLSGTEQSVGALEAVPWLPDLLATWEKKVADHVHVHAGYDLGVKKPFVGLQLSDSSVSVKGTYFHNNKDLRVEGRLKLQKRHSFWATYTHNDKGELANSTVRNLKKREMFVINPFTLAYAPRAAGYTYNQKDYDVEVGVNLNTEEPFVVLHANKRSNYPMTLGYAMKKEKLLFEVNHKPDNKKKEPHIKVYATAPVSKGGFKSFGAGIMLEKSFDL